MTLPVILSPEARAEFDEAYDWYESQRSGLGETFANRVQQVLNRIARIPQLHPVVLSNIRKAVVQRFPYCVFSIAKNLLACAFWQFTIRAVIPRTGKIGLDMLAALIRGIKECDYELFDLAGLLLEPPG